VSLLLKALKQAEATNTGRNAPSADLELEPVPAMAGKQGREWVEPPTMLFGNSGLPPEPSREKLFRWPRLSLVPLTALLAAIIALVYAAYLYFALQPQDAPALIQTPPAAAQAKPAAINTASLAPVAEQAPAQPAVAPKPKAQPAAIAQAESKPAPAAARPTSASPRTQIEAASPVSLPRFQPDSQAVLLNDAYGAYQQGQLDRAEQLYSQAAARQRSTDALLGLAAIAATQNRESDAVRLYREILERDPRNSTAQAALLDLLGNSDSQATESRLKILIDRESSPHLFQTLGNLYADQKRWNEAQAAYFEAYRGAPDNADYAYNLAVSLDQLRQHPAALSYYERALAAGGVHRFDRAQAEERIRQLRALP
jgi:tetratricopeptide (TPR) repeat protein